MRHRRSHSLAVIAAVAALLSAGAARSQTVQMFDEAPPLEVLRHIMVPESSGGASRSIVLGHPAPSEVQGPLQRVSTHALPLPQPAPPPPASATAPLPAATEAQPVVQPATPAARPDAAASAGIVGFRIGFAFDSVAIPADYAGFIQRIGTLLQQEPQVKLRIEGHTDAVGTEEYNLNLSKRRALSVARYLVEQGGIAPERLAVVGKGKSEPITGNPYDADNRRVQFVRIE